MSTIRVTRLDHYPVDNPVSWAIGFTVETSNGRSFYKDTTVSYQEAGNDNLAIDLAYAKLQKIINEITARYEQQGSRLGSEYVNRDNPPVATVTIIETPIEETTEEGETEGTLHNQTEEVVTEETTEEVVTEETTEEE